MREIKFRAWDKDNKVMIESAGVGTIGEVLNGRNEMMDNCELMQFTGLKDKNGKEIYEGDIVELDIRTKNGFLTKQKAQTIWWDEQARFTDFIPKEMPAPLGEPIGRTVIGNLYENPELLDSK